jgi:hypothetical protein
LLLRIALATDLYQAAASDAWLAAAFNLLEFFPKSRLAFSTSQAWSTLVPLA